MPRPLRINYPNACYHVMNRGANRQMIFKNNNQRTIFIDLLRECKKLYNIHIYAYCLMDNHYHLLLSTPDANLSRVMRHLNGVYTQKYNQLMKRDGSLFRGRYLAKLVEEDCYRLLLTRYIHLNPVEAGIVDSPAEFRWSSYRAYLGFTTKTEWLSMNSITDQLRSTASLAHVNDYRDYVEGKQLDEINIYQSTKHTSPIIGSTIFKEQSFERINPNHIEACSTDIKRVKSPPSILLISKLVCAYYKIDHETLVKGMSRNKNIPKLVFIHICKNEFGLTLHSITPYVAYKRYESVSAAAHKCKLELKKSAKLVEEVNRITVYINEALKNENDKSQHQ